MNNFDWAQFEEIEAEEDEQFQPPAVSPEEFNWEDFEEVEEEKPIEEASKEGLRHLSRVGSRVGETLVGMPGDIVQFAEWVTSKLPKVPEIFKQEDTFLEKKGREFLKNLPTSNELKDKMSEITEGFTDPQNAVEEFGDSIVELASSLVVGKDPTKVKNLLSALGKATTAKTAVKGVELLGAEERGKFATELGTLFLMGLKDKKMASKFVSDKYQKAKNLIPEGTMLKTQDLTGQLSALEKDLSTGLSTASKNEVKSAVSELKAKVSGGAFPAEELVESFHDINERMASKKLFDDLSKSERKKLKFRYDKFKDNVTSELEKYGKDNPKFLKEWKEANEAYGTIENSKKVSNFISKKYSKLPSHLAGGIVFEILTDHPQAALTTAAGASAAFGALKSGELMYRIAKSPTLRGHYLDTIKAASAENFPAMVNSWNKLETGLKEDLVEESD